jgi:hypothetical protein
MPAQQTTGRVNILILYKMARSLNTRIWKKFKINSKMMRNAIFSKQLQPQWLEPCWNGPVKSRPFTLSPVRSDFDLVKRRTYRLWLVGRASSRAGHQLPLRLTYLQDRGCIRMRVRTRSKNQFFRPAQPAVKITFFV